MTYIQPHMVKALAEHELEVVASVDGVVQILRMKRAGTGTYRVQLTFTKEGIAIQGDINLGANVRGVCSSPGYGIGWFAGGNQPDGKLTESYLCEKFLRQTWQHEAAKRSIESWILQEQAELGRTMQAEVDGRPNELPMDILAETDFSEEEASVRSWKAIWHDFGDETTQAELHEVGMKHITDFWYYGIGVDYPLADAGWLCAIQQRFAVLYTALCAEVT